MSRRTKAHSCVIPIIYMGIYIKLHNLYIILTLILGIPSFEKTNESSSISIEIFTTQIVLTKRKHIVLELNAKQ